MENKRLEYIPVEKIHPHPDNPRKDLGDLSELAESIKANGVLQNLTVSPMIDLEDPDAFIGHEQYTVVIGHRRLAAAKLAGLKEVPCIVAYMDRHEELQTMLLENIQRTDLTVYEQAQGFQMMMDLGDTVEDIAAASGFSQSTVRRRVKLLELDPKKFKASEARGATLQDYMELDKLSDPKTKNKVLDAIGTPDFRNTLAKAVDDEHFKKRLAGWKKQVSTFATKIKERGKVDGADVPMDYFGDYGRWYSNENIKTPEKDDERKYFYTESGSGITIYRERKESKNTEEELRREAEREAFNRSSKQFEEITARHFNLRLDFIKQFHAAKKHITEIARFAATTILRERYCCFDVDDDIASEIIGYENEDGDYEDFRAAIVAFAAEKPEYTLLVCTYAGADDESLGYWQWTYENGVRVFVHKENEILSRIYDLLISLGYEMSSEEKAMRDGTHELFGAGQKENGEGAQ